ncbi:hypothetical protein ABGF28_01500, partial [Helcococcus ovis]|uniref:hypothetical protein n=1 Tax=Helcococcus ovis TaxID=72026 RepID=UPI0038B6FADD
NIYAFIKLLFIDYSNTFGNLWYIPVILAIYTILPIISVAIKTFVKCSYFTNFNCNSGRIYYTEY